MALKINLTDATKNIDNYQTYNGKQNVAFYSRKSRLHVLETKPGLLNKIYRLVINTLIKCKFYTKDQAKIKALVTQSTNHLLNSKIKPVIFQNLEKDDRNTLKDIEDKKKSVEDAIAQAEADAKAAKSKAEQDLNALQQQVKAKEVELQQAKQKVVDENVKVDALAQDYIQLNDGILQLKDEKQQLEQKIQEYHPMPCEEYLNQFAHNPRFSQIAPHKIRALFVDIGNLERDKQHLSHELDQLRETNKSLLDKLQHLKDNPQDRQPDLPVQDVLIDPQEDLYQDELFGIFQN